MKDSPFIHRTGLVRLFLLLLSFSFSGSMSGQEVFDSLLKTAEQAVYFDFGSFELTPAGDSVVQFFAQRVQGGTRPKVYLTAHTDAIGTIAANRELSEKRGAVVRERLLELGVPDSIVLIRPFGEERPTATNDTEAGRQLNRRATMELFENVRLTYLEGQIKDLETLKGIPARIFIRSKTLNDSLDTDTTGFFKTAVPDLAVIGIDAFSRGYFFESKMLKINSLQPTELEMALPPAGEGMEMTLKNFYFVGNEAILLPTSRPELARLLKFMEVNQGLRIEIAGHINLPNAPKVETNTWHYDLSVRRAKMVYDYLVENGISADRMTYKGYGNWEMLFPRTNLESEQSQNRRVEIKIISESN